MSLTTDYIISLCLLYGIVHKEKVVEIYNKQNKDKVTLADIELIMENQRAMLENHFVYVEESYFIHETIFAFDEFDSYMSKKAGKPYYIPNKNELLKYMDQFYFEKTKEFEILVDYIANELMEGDYRRAHAEAEDIQALCQMEATPTEILNEMSRRVDFKSEEQLSEIVGLVLNISNNTRLWSNNGHTPKELFETYEKQHLHPLPDDNREKKIGRNDPCPCGSGKKYKKCCL